MNAEDRQWLTDLAEIENTFSPWLYAEASEVAL